VKDDEVEAAIKIKVGQKLVHEVSEGNGPVHALDLALRKALLPSYPKLADMKLVDYSVRVIGDARETTDGNSLGGSGSTGSLVRVMIQSQDRDGQTWGTIAVSTNILAATWAALVDAIDYKRLLDLKAGWEVMLSDSNVSK
jgi:2-isopropylmalate synthase